MFGGFASNTPGTTASTQSSGLGFGTTPAFGTNPAASAASTGFGFNTKPAATGSTGFSFGTTPGTTSGFGLPTTGGSTSTGFGFGTTPASTTGSGLFGTNTAFGGFGAKPATGAFTGFGATTTTSQSTGFGLGAGTTPGGLFGQPQQQQQQLQLQQQQQVQQQNVGNTLVNMGTAVSLPMIYGDERDAILARLNQVQAYWGTGKGFFSQSGAVDFTQENPFCRFKAIGYSCIPTSKNEDGLVSITFQKSVKEVRDNQQSVVDNLHKMFGNSPNLSVCVEALKPAPEDRADLVIYVLERQPAGLARRIPSIDLYTHLVSQTVSQQLTQLSVTGVLPKAGFSDDQLKQYLDRPPVGIDPLLWNQARLDNPNPSKLIPVPIIGFGELLKRRQHQEQQTKLHQARLDLISSDISELQRKHTNTIARTDQYRRKYLELGHRVLKLMVKQEIYRKLGYGIQSEEELLRVQLEALMSELSAPMQFKGRLNELMSQIRMQNQMMTSRPEYSFQMDPAYLDEVKAHLHEQQKGIQHLISIIKDDLEDLTLIKQQLTLEPARK